MRSLIKTMLLGLAFLLASPIVGQARALPHGTAAGKSPSSHQGASAPVTVHVTTGYQSVYRDTAWTPVRVTLHNTTSADLSGTLQLPQNGQSSAVGASQSFHGLYEASVTLPAGSTKSVTVYVPGSGIQDLSRVTFRQGNRVLATAVTYPMGIDSSALLVGVMGRHPGDSAWVGQAIQQQVTTHVVHLSPATLDPVPEALGAFDIIVLTNVDTSQLDRAQLLALERYVHNGGSLLLVGGPTWQETLRPLPAALLPGRLSGTRTLPDLHGLNALIAGAEVPAGTAQGAAVSVLTHSSGSVLAAQTGVPLAVREVMGHGAIEYLAFDPSLNPVQSWSGATRTAVLQRLVAASAPLAISRTWSPQGFRGRFLRAFTSMAITGELSNVPPFTLPLLAIFAGLTLLYVLLLGPANFLVLRRLNHQHLAWVTIPALALSYLASAYGLTVHLRSSNVLVHSVGMITLGGNPGQTGARGYPATLYMGIFTPLPGDYRLTYNAPALPAPLPQIKHPDGFFWRSASTLTDTPLGVRIQEGARTDITFPGMQRWSARDVALNTTVQIPGTVQSDLAVNAQGAITGPIHNGTNLDLLDPVIVAGQTVGHLSTIAAGATVHAQVTPSGIVSGADQSSVWTHLYGGSDVGTDGFAGFGDCCDGPTFAQEKTLDDRVQNAIAMLSQAQPLSKLGEVVLVGWSEKPLGTLTVDGHTPQRRDLNLIVVPLTVHLPSHGAFRLRTGTLEAHLVDMVPRAPQSSCCTFFSRRVQQISVGTGGSLTFEFDMPAAHRLQLKRLEVSVNSGLDSTPPGSVYDWRAHRWVPVDLSSESAQLVDPNRFVSSGGRLLLKLQATAGSGDIAIDDPIRDVQVSGVGRVT